MWLVEVCVVVSVLLGIVMEVCGVGWEFVLWFCCREEFVEEVCVVGWGVELLFFVVTVVDVYVRGWWGVLLLLWCMEGFLRLVKELCDCACVGRGLVEEFGLMVEEVCVNGWGGVWLEGWGEVWLSVDRDMIKVDPGDYSRPKDLRKPPGYMTREICGCLCVGRTLFSCSLILFSYSLLL